MIFFKQLINIQKKTANLNKTIVIRHYKTKLQLFAKCLNNHKNHTKKLINNNKENKDESLNCRKKLKSPLKEGQYKPKNVVYS